MKACFYCGDAAGRPKTANRPKDFSDTDLKFAANIGLKFLTPEQLFLDEKPDKSTNSLIDTFFKKALLKKADSDPKGRDQKRGR